MHEGDRDADGAIAPPQPEGDLASHEGLAAVRIWRQDLAEERVGATGQQNRSEFRPQEESERHAQLCFLFLAIIGHLNAPKGPRTHAWSRPIGDPIER
jgi:hypothetical protein